MSTCVLALERAGLLLLALVAMVAFPAAGLAASADQKGAEADTRTPDYAPGRIVVKLTPGAAAALGGDQRLSSPGLGATLLGLRVSRVEPLFRDLWPGVRTVRAADRAAAVRARFPQRAARAPRGVAVPDLENTFIFHLPQTADVLEAANALRAVPGVVSAEPDWRVEPVGSPNDPEFLAGNQWGLEWIHAPAAWDITTGDPGVVIAVVDTGVAWDHPDLASRIWTNPGETPGNGLDDDGNGYADDTRGWDFGESDNDPMDHYGHGTLCAGVAGAATDNGLGVAGVTWQCPIMAVKTADADDLLWTSNVAAGIIYAADNGASVVSLSLGGYYATDMAEAIQYALATGVVVVGAAGNEGTEAVSFPASLPGVLAVGASVDDDWSPRVNFPEWWASNWGYCLDVLAPGHNIRTTDMYAGYDSWDGTSLATPIVAGVVGLVLSQHPEFSAEEIRHVLRGTAIAGRSGTWNREWGGGVVNATAALGVNLVPDLHLLSPLPQRQLQDVAALYVQDQPAIVTGKLTIEGIAAGEGVSGWQVEYGKGYDPDLATRVVVAQGNGPASGTLAELDAADLEPGVYNLELGVSTTEGYLFREWAHFLADSTQHPGWPVAATWEGMYFITAMIGPFCTPPLVADVNRDGASEIVQETHAFGADGQVLAGWDPNEESSFAWATTGDLDGDHRLEAISADLSGWLTVTRWDGTPLPTWPASVPRHFRNGQFSPVATADLDRDRRDEIVASWWYYGDDEEFSSGLYAIRSDGTVLPGWPYPMDEPELFNPPAIGDIDRDGAPEVVSSSYTPTSVHVIRASGDAMPGWPVLVPDFVDGAAALADLQGDRALEIIVPCEDNAVRAWSAAGQPIPGWPAATEAPVWGLPALGDVDDDGRPEVFVGALDRRLYAWRADGSTLPGWPVAMASDCYFQSPVIGDIDGDRQLEVLAGTLTDGDPDIEGQAWIYAFRADGTEVPGFPKESAIGIWGLALGDVDGDRLLELVAASEGFALNMWDLPARDARGRAPWPMTCGNPSRTSAYPNRGAR